MVTHKVIRIPKYLHEIHGESATPLGIYMTYLAGIIFGLIGVMSMAQLQLEPWKLLLIGILFFDIGGGVIANLTSSTNHYYQKSEKQRVFYLLLHIAQPLILGLLLDGYWSYVSCLAIYTIISAFIINKLPTTESQQVTAGFLVVVGIGALSLFDPLAMSIYAFGVLYMIKLLIGFAVRRPDVR